VIPDHPLISRPLPHVAMSTCAHRKLPAIWWILAMTDLGLCAESSMRGAAPANSSVTAASDPANSSVTATSDPVNSSVTAASDPKNSSGMARRFGDGGNVLMEYFAGNFHCAVPNLADRWPQRKVLVPSMHIPPSPALDPIVYGIQTGSNWGARFSSLLRISQGGRYTFEITTSWADSVALTVDGYRVIAASCGQHRPTGSMSLAAGYHDVVLTYTDDGWHDSMVLSYNGPDTHDTLQVVPPSRFSANQWVLGAQGHSCITVCHALGKQCDSQALQSGVTTTEITSIGALVSYTCDNTVGWAYHSNPGICTDPRCCNDGSCIGWCAYGNTGVRSCAATNSHYSRFCPCAMPAFLV